MWVDKFWEILSPSFLDPRSTAYVVSTTRAHCRLCQLLRNVLALETKLYSCHSYFLFRVVHDVDLVVAVEGKANVSGVKATWSQRSE